MRVSRGRNGFTLLELLVVIIIVGILAVVGAAVFTGPIDDVKKQEGEQYLKHLTEELNSYVIEEPTFVANDFESRRGIRQSLDYYDKTTLTYTNIQNPLDATSLIQIQPKVGGNLPNLQAVYDPVTFSWTISTY